MDADVDLVVKSYDQRSSESIFAAKLPKPSQALHLETDRNYSVAEDSEDLKMTRQACSKIFLFTLFILGPLRVFLFFFLAS